MAEVSFTGGARIGWVNASYPFAKLSCSRERLMLASLGTYEFTPDQVVSFGTYGSIPLLANGLRINHNRLDYPEKVVFWCAGSRDKVLREVGRMGFAPRGQPITRPKGFAFKWTVVIAFVVIWNLMFFMDRGFSVDIKDVALPGPGAFVATFMTFVVSTAMKLSSRIQRIALTPGHSFGEVKAAVTLVQLITGAFATGIGLALYLTKG